MIPRNIERIIEVLIEKTENKQALWSKTSRQSEFKLLLDSGAITVDNWYNDEHQTNMVDIAIYNKRGDRIEYHSAMKDTDDYEVISKLYYSANRDYYKVDETIDGLFNEISLNKKIGKKDASDDLPF